MNDNDVDTELKEKLKLLSHVTMPEDSVNRIMQSLDDAPIVSHNRRHQSIRRKLTWLSTSAAAIIMVIVGGSFMLESHSKPSISQKPGTTTKHYTQPSDAGATSPRPPDASGVMVPANVTWNGLTYAVTSDRVQNPGKHIGQYNGFNLYRIPSTEPSHAIAIEIRSGMFFKAIQKK